MVKYLFLIMIVSLTLELSHSQIPNGGFEMWEEVYNYEKPLGWYTNQDTFHSRFEKDTVSIEGNYSLKIIPGVTSTWFNCVSQAIMRIDFKVPLPSNSVLSFYYKTIPFDSNANSDVYLNVYVYTLDSNTHLNAYEWSASASVEEFTKAEIPLFEKNINAISVYIYGGAGSNPVDGPCLNRSISWIDGMGIDSKTSEEHPLIQSNFIVSVYPNPSNGLVNISYPYDKPIIYELYSLIGELIFKGATDNGQLIIYEKGTYLLKLFVDSGSSYAFYNKLIVVQ